MTDFDRFKVMKAKRMVSTVHTHFYSLVDLVNLVMTSYCSIKIFSDSVKPLANVFFFLQRNKIIKHEVKKLQKEAAKK